MHFFRLFRRREFHAARAEPCAFAAIDTFSRGDADTPGAYGEPLAMLGEKQAGDDLHSNADIFGLFGTNSTLDGDIASQFSENVDSDDLISSLHRQYCQALANPLGVALGADWESPPVLSGRHMRRESALPGDSCAHHAGQESIEALLSGAQQLDHAFGPLGESDLGALSDTESVPEILRLFAPPEYLASAFPIAARPPPLARREHHSLGIDSPLPMPKVSQIEDAS